jgi:hypothetical protein
MDFHEDCHWTNESSRRHAEKDDPLTKQEDAA